MKQYVAIMNWDQSFRNPKYQDFDTLLEATNLANQGGTLPGTIAGAFAAQSPSDKPEDWLVNPGAETIADDPLPVVMPTVISYEDFEDRFTSQQADDVAAWVYAMDANTGGPLHPSRIKQYNRAISANKVDLERPSTASFMAQLVSAGIVTQQESDVILTP
jgi:hypothetical protein